MKKTIVSIFTALLVSLAGIGGVAAQDDDGMLVIPVELFVCSYNEKKGPDDLDKVIDKWNAWADEHDIDDYAAWTLSPYYFGAEQEFDVIWLGAGKDAVALGKAQDKWVTSNDGLQGEFDAILSCDTHANFASINFKAPPEGATPTDTVLTFSDCKYQEGASFTKLDAAMTEWSNNLAGAGSKTGIWHWYPVYGGGGEEYDFKWIESHANLADLGADYEHFGNGGAYEAYGTLFGGLIKCDSSRAYLARSHRFVQLR